LNLETVPRCTTLIGSIMANTLRKTINEIYTIYFFS
jgi:hypothetical protein